MVVEFCGLSERSIRTVKTNERDLSISLDLGLRQKMIELLGITKYYGNIKALDNLSLHIDKGCIFGLLGPNGAGKTTTIKILTALTRQDSGTCLIDGYDINEYPILVKSKIAVVPQENNLDRELTVYDNLKIYGMLYGVKDLDKIIMNNLKKVGLEDKTNTLVTKLSGGMQRRLLLVRALMREPSILFLDEPSIGLDPQIRRSIWDIIRLTRHEGRTVVITTHYIEEADALCDKIAILSKGRLIALDTPEKLKAMIGKYVVEYVDKDGKIIRSIKNNKFEAEKYANLQSANLTIRESNLEDVFIELTGERI